MNFPLTLFKQRTAVTCGAAAYRIALSDKVCMSEKQAVDEAGTTPKGTALVGVYLALRERKIESYFIKLHQRYEDYLDWLKLNSTKFKMVCCFDWMAGRKVQACHAAVAYQGYIYDSAEDEPIEIDVYAIRKPFKGKLVIREAVFIPTENH